MNKGIGKYPFIIKGLTRLCFFSLLLFTIDVFSQQLCGGTFGNPVFKETFGSVSTTAQTISPALVPPAYSAYHYSSNFPPSDGWYTISNNTVNAGWSWSNSVDHTSLDGYGNMLIVNADYNPGEFYRRRVSGLCSNQVYRFSAWILNIHTASETTLIKPNVTFQIRNTSDAVIGSVNSGDIAGDAVPQWHNFYIDFQTDLSSTSVDVVLINNAAGGMGNDLAIDDISFSACGPATRISSGTSNVFTTGDCDNLQNVQLTAQLLPNTYQNANYIWQKSIDGGATWQNITAQSTSPVLNIPGGTYSNNDQYRFIVGEGNNINSAYCQVISTPSVIKISGYPNPPTSNSIDLCQYSTANALSANGSNLLWYTAPSGGIGSSKAPVPDTSTLGTQFFWVSQTVNGCESKTRAQVTVHIIPIPSPPIVSNYSFCQNSTSATLSAVGSNLLWYDSDTGGVGNPIPPSPKTDIAGTFSYWVSQNSGTCESKRAQVVVHIFAQPFSSSLKDTSICDGDKVILDVGTGFSSSVWNTVPPVDSQTLTVTKSGTYQVTLTDRNGCTATQSVNVSEGITPSITYIASGEDYLVVFAEGGNPPYFYSNDGGASWQSSNKFSGLKPGIYHISVKSQTNSCIANQSSAILDVPNVMTPNQDGYNDAWKIKYLAYFPKAKIQIFDRYGKLLIKQDDLSSFEWLGQYDGRILPKGTYWYVLSLDETTLRTGWVFLNSSSK